jgi:transcriptional regulator with XRE-family HTH domain
MSNPFRDWREKRGLSRTEMAVLLNLSVSHIQAIETGMPNRPFKKFVRNLAASAGPDLADQLVADYATWREAQRAQTLEKIRTN